MAIVLLDIRKTDRSYSHVKLLLIGFGNVSYRDFVNQIIINRNNLIEIMAVTAITPDNFQCSLSIFLRIYS